MSKNLLDKMKKTSDAKAAPAEAAEVVDDNMKPANPELHASHEPVTGTSTISKEDQAALDAGQQVAEATVFETQEVLVIQEGDKMVDCSEPSTEPDFDEVVEGVTVGNLLDMHRMLSYCMRGNQRPAVLQVQKLVVSLLPEGTPIKHRNPV